MKYNSTRNSKESFNASTVIAKGISEEGGLFVPESFPFLGDRLAEISNLDYFGVAQLILEQYLTDYTKEEIKSCISSAYALSKFEGEQAPLKTITQNTSMLELWHGPTCAFKDMALQLLPHLLTVALKKGEEDKKAVILVATSGDTGKAALEGFKNVAGTQVIVFYPDNGVSPMQLRQMTTQEGDNLSVCAVKGNFDDCQTQVKNIFTNEEIKNLLNKSNMVFSSANSINWGRLLPQIVYYFYSYAQLLKTNKIKAVGEKVNFVVPTGNFGNILAAYYAYKMGLPVNKLICASNSNNVLTDFINTGTYNKNREFYTTSSPSMDILVSSNLERLLYHLCGNDSKRLTEWMNSLNENSSYTVDASTASGIKKLFYGGFCSDKATAHTIKETFDSSNYLCDTHTAVAVKVYGDYIKETNDLSQTVIVSTASPYKFAPMVLNAIEGSNLTDEFEIVNKLSKISGLKVPDQINALSNKERIFNNMVDKETIADFVLENLEITR